MNAKFLSLMTMCFQVLVIVLFNFQVEKFFHHYLQVPDKEEDRICMLHFFKNKDNQVICQLHVNTLYRQKAIFHLFLIFISCIIINMIIILQIGTVLILRWQKLHSFCDQHKEYRREKKKWLVEINL